MLYIAVELKNLCINQFNKIIYKFSPKIRDNAFVEYVAGNIPDDRVQTTLMFLTSFVGDEVTDAVVSASSTLFYG